MKEVQILTTQEEVWKAYYITCELLATFQEKGGWHSRLGEKELLLSTFGYLQGSYSEKDYLQDLDFTFGLGRKHLRLALISYRKFERESPK